MDWSLVLVSQGIESTIECPPETQQWQLVVARSEYQRAIRAIRQFHIENRGAWVREIPWSGMLFDWRAAAWVIALIAIFFLDAASRGAWQTEGLMSNTLVRQGEWWRLFTATTLHADVAHLAINLTTGFLLIGLTMGAYGAGLGLLATFLAGVGGNLAGLLLYASNHRSLGASGVVMGALGLITVQSIGPRGVVARDLIVRALCGGFLLLVLLGLSPDPRTDLVAHIGGFLSGVILGLLLSLGTLKGGHQTVSNSRMNPMADSIASVIFVAVITITWIFAFR